MKRSECATCQRDAEKARRAFASAQDTADYLAHDCQGHVEGAPAWEPYGGTPAATIPSPAEVMGARPAVDPLAVEAMVLIVVAKLRQADSSDPKATVRGKVALLPEVARRMEAVGWRTRITKGGARDMGATDELQVFA